MSLGFHLVLVSTQESSHLREQTSQHKRPQTPASSPPPPRTKHGMEVKL